MQYAAIAEAVDMLQEHPHCSYIPAMSFAPVPYSLHWSSSRERYRTSARCERYSEEVTHRSITNAYLLI